MYHSRKITGPPPVVIALLVVEFEIANAVAWCAECPRLRAGVVKAEGGIDSSASAVSALEQVWNRSVLL